MPFMLSSFGNPHSKTHAYGWEAEAAMENARKVIVIVVLMIAVVVVTASVAFLVVVVVVDN